MLPRLLAVLIVALLAAGGGGLADVHGSSSDKPTAAPAPAVPTTEPTTTTTTTVPPTSSTTAAPTTTTSTTTVPRTTTTTRPATTTTTAPHRQIFTLTLNPKVDQSTSAPVGADLELRVPSNFTPILNNIGDANPAIVARDVGVAGCAAPSCLAFRILAQGATKILFEFTGGCGLPGQPTCPPGEFSIAYALTFTATAP